MRDKLYVGMLLTCRRCNCMVTEYYFDHPEVSVKAVLCKVCKLQVKPPELMLREHAGHLWNITQSRFEKNFTLKEFGYCGWFLREHTTIFPIAKVPLQKNTDVYRLEYYGNRKCIRFVNYPFYYEDMTACITSKCRDIM